jgi:class 3 adenylate cyclase/tetratricopeptide (TPR) repeat protein
MGNPATFRYCGGCGRSLGLPTSPLPSPAPGLRERRQLTVLFCDLVGSTQLSTRLDAEDLGDVIAQYFALCKSVFERHGGFVDGEQGDSLRVYFGYPHSRDDDARRAALAALDAVAEVRALGERLGARVGAGLEVHVGIDTGEAVVGEDAAGAAGPLVVGEVPNIARRLQEAAAAGTVLVGGNTHRLIASGFDCLPLESLVLKGLPQPLAAWRLVGDRGYAGAIELFGARALPPLLGRDAELALLEQRWSRAREGHGQVVLISGEPGIGKSRLAHAFVAALAHEPHSVHVLQCHEQYANSALYPAAELLERRLHFTRDDGASARRTKLDAAFGAGVLPEPSALACAAALLSLPADELPALPARRLRERTLEWLTLWLLGGTAARPAALVIEDAHWADATTLEFVAAAVSQVASRRAMLIVTCRPEFMPSWTLRSHISMMSLQRLSAAETLALVASIAGRLDAGLLKQIVARSDGVPLYAEELASMLVGSGADAAETASALPTSVPQTLRGSLTARLDHLKTAKPLAQMASVLGREFPYRLARLVSGQDDAELLVGLAELVRAELLFENTASPEPSYAFKHVLLQEAAYLSLLKAQRIELHARTAAALVEHFGELTAAHPEIVALHFAAAGRSAEAADGWHRAGVLALEASAYVEAVAHLRRALEQLAALPLGERSGGEVKCLITLGSALAETRGYASTEVEETFGRVYRVTEGLGDGDELYSALTGLHAFQQVRGQLRRAVASARRLVHLSSAGDDALRRAQAHRCLGWSLLCTGDFTGGEQHLQQALGLFDRLRVNEHSRLFGMHPWVAGFANSGLLQWFLGRPEQALARCREAQALARELRQPLAMAYALAVSAAVHTCRREPTATLELAREVTQIASGDAMPYWAAWVATLGGWALAGLGNYDEGLAQLREGLDRYRATGAQLFEPWSLGLLAEVHADAGKPDLALAAIESALASPLLADGYFYAAELYRMKGALLRATGTPAHEAEQFLRRALELARAQGARVFESRAAESLGAGATRA